MNKGSFASPITYTQDLFAFRRWQPLDEQRINGKWHREFVDYATIAIGLYGAASDTPATVLLTIQNWYARTSQFDPDVTRDPLYTNLPETNVRNTLLGYRLFQRNAFGNCNKHMLILKRKV